MSTKTKSGYLPRRPKGLSSWKDKTEMRQNASVKFSFYTVQLSSKPTQMIDLKPVDPYARYAPKGQQLQSQHSNFGLGWLIDEMKKRLLHNPAYSDWQVAIVYLSTGYGTFNNIARYYVKNGRQVEYIAPKDWPNQVKNIYENLKTNHAPSKA
jgi:hypothetical protein